MSDLTVIPSEKGDRFYMKCEDTESIANIECCGTSFEFHFIPSKPLSGLLIVCDSCGHEYNLVDVMKLFDEMEKKVANAQPR
jgi:hypothetical protein